MDGEVPRYALWYGEDCLDRGATQKISGFLRQGTARHLPCRTSKIGKTIFSGRAESAAAFACMDMYLVQKGAKKFWASLFAEPPNRADWGDSSLEIFAKPRRSPQYGFK